MTGPTGYFWFDEAFSTATGAFLSNADAAGNNVAGWVGEYLAANAPGPVIILAEETNGIFFVFTTVQDNQGPAYDTLPITPIFQNGSPNTGDLFYFSVTLAGYQ